MAQDAQRPRAGRRAEARRGDGGANIPTAEMESFFAGEEDASRVPPKHYPRARPLAEGETRDATRTRPADHLERRADPPSPAQMQQLAETGEVEIATRSSSGAARTGRTGPTSSSTRRRSTSRRRSTPRRSSTI